MQIEPIIILLAIGAVGGIIRAVLGYEQQADEGESFDYLKMAKSVVRAAVIGAFVVFGSTAVTQGELTTSTYIMAFFIAVGADVIAKEGFGTLKGG